MTVLRSREVVPIIKSQSPRKTLKKGDIEPATPVKDLEPSNNQSSPTPNSTPLAQNPNPTGLGSGSVSFSGTILRRSLRLVSRSNSNGVVDNVPVSNRKGKCITAENSMNCNNGSDFRNVRRESVLSVEDRVLDLEVKNARVSYQNGNMVRVSGDLGIEMEGNEKEGIDEMKMDLEKSVTVAEEVEVSIGFCKSELSFEMGSSGRRSKRVVRMAKVKGKRKLGSDIGSSALKLLGDDERENGLSKLRTGMKIAKRIMEGINGEDGDSFCGAENNNGEKSVHENEGRDKDKQSKSVLNGGCGDTVVVNESERDPKVDENGTLEGRRRSIRGGKEKAKLVNMMFTSSGADPVELGVEPKGEKSNCNAVSDPAYLLGKVTLKELNESGTSVKWARRLSRAEKGKAIVVEDLLPLNRIDVMELDSEPKLEKLINSAVSSLADNVALQGERQVTETNKKAIGTQRREYKERFREIARQNASRFAHFSSQDDEENQVTAESERVIPSSEVDRGTEDWPGPFSTAMKIIKDREMNVNVQHQSSFSDKSKSAPVIWVPKNVKQHERPKKLVPSLQELCMAILAKNADAITSLDGVPDVLRHKLCQLLCDSRRMNSNFLALLVCGSPTQVRVRDCSWLTEEKFTRIFEGCDTSNLTVLQLDQCGRCMPDYVLFLTLARSSNSLPVLTRISLKGACRLSDVGLRALVSSAPALRSINLSQCSLLTFTGINVLADSLGSVLKELYLDDCQNMDHRLILPALKKLEHLEVLSLAGNQAVSDDFIHEFIVVRGLNMKELILADCVKLTDSSLKVIAETCSGLCALDLVNLRKLTDSAIEYLANGCRVIQTLKLCRNAFSDEAIAAFLETSGESLKELSLNNVIKVGPSTAVSLAKCSRNLLSLDLSWCRNLTDETLGLIVDSCLSLKLLKLFGCNQITKVFLDGHSNPLVQIVGLKTTPLLDQLRVPDPLEGPLHYSASDFDMTTFYSIRYVVFQMLPAPCPACSAVFSFYLEF
ncbi:hypothetical protein F0562_009740 [Nyssa sinensis]|uniref:Uncharacterized protein n=1 Tax=Nyssa sinensis TaxID=561372 RepID=A0A5J5A1W2_9ASTE|nr:hypothetical protein F0562_009740 [Nyssa sinensis]